MKRGRWIAVGACSLVVAGGTGLLYLALYGGFEQESIFRYVPYVGLGLYTISPILAGWLSGSPAPVAAAAGGLALGIAATVTAAAVDQGGSGAMPLTFGIAIGGTIALRGNAAEIWARLAAVTILAVYALVSGRFASVLFAYPMLGLADEFADILTARRAGTPEDEPQRVTTGRS